MIPKEERGLHTGKDNRRRIEKQRNKFRKYELKALERNVIELVDEFALAIFSFRPSFCLESLIMCLFTTSLGNLKLSILLLETTSIVLLGKYLVKKCRMTLFVRQPGTIKLCWSLNNSTHEGEFWAFFAGFFFGI